jgi:acetyl-CoA carboxylase, biotin carboxyl carrier protein
MKLDEIRKLAELMQEFDLESAAVKEDDCEIQLRRASNTIVPVFSHAPPAASPAPADEAPAEPIPDGKLVTSPIVGVFYSASAPDALPFAAIGQTVAQGDVLCIVEAMKMMNEITADFGGEVTEILAKDGDIVAHGQPLFRLK